MVQASKRKDVIEVRRLEDDKNDWSKATKMDCGDWMVIDGKTCVSVKTEDLLGKNWVINSEVDEIKEDINKERQSKWRRLRESEDLIAQLAKRAAEEERKKEIRRRFHYFNELPHNERTFGKFEDHVIEYISSPSDHTVVVNLNDSENTMDTVSHESGSVAMRQLVTHQILKHLVQASNEREKLIGQKKKKRNNRVGKVRKGSDGFRKLLQIDEQNENDIVEEENEGIRKKVRDTGKLMRRWKAACEIKRSDKKKRIWKSGVILDETKINGKDAGNIICMFALKKCSGMNKEDKVLKVNGMKLTKQEFDEKLDELKWLMREADIEEDCLSDVLEESNLSDDNESRGRTDGETEEEVIFDSDINDTTDGESDEIDLDLMDKYELRKEYEKTGLKVDNRWSHKTLLQILKEGKGSSEDEDSSVGETEGTLNVEIESESETDDMDGNSDEDKLELMDKPELIQECKRRGLKGDRRFTREKLLENLKQHLKC